MKNHMEILVVGIRLLSNTEGHGYGHIMDMSILRGHGYGHVHN